MLHEKFVTNHYGVAHGYAFVARSHLVAPSITFFIRVIDTSVSDEIYFSKYWL